MMEWFTASWQSLVMAALSTIVLYAVIIGYTRIFGLRSFSKMSAFDFAMTVAVGSLFAATISAPSPSILLGAATLGFLFLGQKLVASARSRGQASQYVDNSPLLLMLEGEALEANMKTADVTHADLRAKLREANVLNYAQVKAVVIESTGDISVLHGQAGDELDSELLRGVIGHQTAKTKLSNSA